MPLKISFFYCQVQSSIIVVVSENGRALLFDGRLPEGRWFCGGWISDDLHVFLVRTLRFLFSIRLLGLNEDVDVPHQMSDKATARLS